MQTPLAILGAGRWGTHLIRHFLQHPRSQVVAIVDPHVERLAAVQQRFHLDAQILLTTDILAAFTLPQLQAVVIATPATTHYRFITEALQRGYHVFAEKPLTVSLAAAVELCELAEKQQRHLFVDHTYLFHPAIERGKTMIQQGTLGKLRYGYAARTHLEPIRFDVDVLWDLAVHDIAIFNTWLGSTPIQVQANGQLWLNFPEKPLAADVIPQTDLVMATLIYPDGFQGFLHLSWLNPDKQRRLGVVGSRGTLIFDELSPTPLMVQRGHLEPQEGGEWKATAQSREVLAIEPIEPLWRVCDHFLECVQQNRVSPISSGWVGAEFVSILCALSESLLGGGKLIPVQKWPR